MDRIGFLSELTKRLVDDQDTGCKPKVKAGMEPGDVVEGDFFEGRLDPSSATAGSPAALLQLHKERVITRKQLLACLSVRVGEVPALGLSLPQLKRVVKRSAGTPRLVVSIRKGVAVELEAAILGIHAALKGDQARDGQKAAA